MDGALYFSAIGGVATTGLRIISAVYFRHQTGFRIADIILALDDVSVAQADLPPGCQAEVFRWGLFAEVLPLNVERVEKGTLRVPAEGSSGLLVASSSSILAFRVIGEHQL